MSEETIGRVDCRLVAPVFGPGFDEAVREGAGWVRYRFPAWEA